MKLSLFAAALLLPGALLAQTNQGNTPLPRGLTHLSTFPSPVNTTGWRYFKVAAPQEDLPADFGRGLVPTSNLVHCTYFDMDSTTGFIPELNHRRSVDGGLTWGKPQVIHSLNAGETTGSTGAVVLTNGHSVVVLFRSTRLTQTGGMAILGYSSNDQGQTWNGPALLTPAFAGSAPKLYHTGGTPSSPEFRAVWSNDKIHIHYEALYTTQGARTNAEECFYSRASLNAQGQLALEIADVPISNQAQPNQFDVDNVEIAADGPIVVCLFQEDEDVSNSNTYNNTVIRISRDNGTTWQPRQYITKFDTVTHSSHPSTDGNSDVAVSGPAIVVITEDNSDQGPHNRFDEVFCHVSLNAGVTFNPPVMISSTVASNDVDDNAIAAQAGKFVINFMEDQGQGNAANRSTVVVGTAVELANGTYTTTDLTGLYGGFDYDLAENISMNDNGRVIAISGETDGGSNGTSEAACLSWSHDGGVTWQTSEVSRGERDVDEPWVTTTINGDLVQIYVEDFPPGGNNNNETFVTGLKAPYLVDDTANSNGVELMSAVESAGGLAVILISGTQPTGNALPLGVNGVQINVPFDIWTNFGLTLPGVFVGAVDPTGTARFPAVQNLSKLAGATIYYTAVTVTQNGFEEFSDWRQF
jgi:hypothetical protein